MAAREPSAEPESASKELRARTRPFPPQRTVDTNAAPLRIAFISYANPQQVLQDSGPVIRFLEPFVGLPIKGFVSSDYSSSIEAMKGDQADLAFVDPLAFMMAHEQIGARPLVLEVYSSGKPSYHSTIWVRRDSGLKSIADLKGKVIAFADQVDMSGHLLPREVFVREGLIGTNLVETEFFKQVYFAGGDEQAIRAVQSRYVDAAGVSQYADLLLRPDERDDVVPLAQSIESPSHLLMARAGLADEICERIQQALLALDASQPADKAILDKLYGVQGYVEAKRSDFAEVAKVAARYGFVKKPESFAGTE